ncbi:MAG: hypothetical protein HYX47_13745 [Burkholderiales bacterium]|nr:hypothetical protein [Burkholderiales bacterium]
MRRLIFLLLFGVCLSASAQVGFGAADASNRVLVVCLLDRPAEYWRDALPLRILPNVLPISARTTRVEVSGLNFVKLVLDTFTETFAQGYPQLTFIPLQGLSEKYSPTPGARLSSVRRGDSGLEAELMEQLKTQNAGSVLFLQALNQKDADRPNPQGSYALMTAGISDTVLPVQYNRWQGFFSFFVEMVATDSRLRAKAWVNASGTSGGTEFSTGQPVAFNFMPGLAGTEAELVEMVSNSRRQEFLDVVRKTVQTGATAGLDRFKRYIELVRDPSPYLPAAPVSGRAGDASAR